MKTIKIFIASSSELKEDRDKFLMFISRENNRLSKEGVYLEIIQWENFKDAISDTRLQDEYNKAIRACEIALCLFFTKVGKYTAEEFDTAYQSFKANKKPAIYTYYKNAAINIGSITEEINSLFEFKKKLASLGHFPTEYTNIDGLINHFNSQLAMILPEIVSTLNANNQAGKVEKPEATLKVPDKNTFNDLLTKRLIEAIKPYSKKVSSFLSTNSDWEKYVQSISSVKNYITNGYVGFVGVQLRKLMAIGESDFSEEKMKNYLDNCQLTSKRALQLVDYTLLSKLWDYRLNNIGKLSQPQTDILVKFFANAAEDNITGFASLLKTIIQIYLDNNLEFPIPQIKDLQLNLAPDSSFMAACNKLDSITDLLTNNSFTVSDCSEAEESLTVILENLNFLAQYKMISIRDIDYAIQRNDKEGLYLHNYTLLDGLNQDNNSNQGKVRKENSPVISYSVLLCKDSLIPYINLAPFVVDYNALANNGGSKICFYSYCNTIGELSLTYTFIDDNHKVAIKNSGNPKPEEKEINRWLGNPKNRIDMNFDNVFNLFNEAKKNLAGLVEDTSDEEL